MIKFSNNRWILIIRHLILISLCGLGATPLLSHATNDKTDSWQASINGLGPIQIGISLPTLTTLLGELEQQKGDGEGCIYYTALNSDRDVSFMLFEGRLVRIDIYSRKTETLSSLRVGDSTERIKQIYNGSLKVISHPNNPDGELLSLHSSAQAFNNYRIVFEANNGIVTNYRLGLLPYVNWLDGCTGER